MPYCPDITIPNSTMEEQDTGKDGLYSILLADIAYSNITKCIYPYTIII